MSGNLTNDNDAVPTAAAREHDAHGPAAILLVESLIHGLIEQSVISVAKAVEIVEVATEVQRNIGIELGENPATLQRSITVLEAISKSLRLDLPRE